MFVSFFSKNERWRSKAERREGGSREKENRVNGEKGGKGRKGEKKAREIISKEKGGKGS